jgi:hypothetical protein
MAEGSEKKRRGRPPLPKDPNVQKRPPGRPPLPEGAMADVTIRLPAEMIAAAKALAADSALPPEGAPETDKSRPTKASILRLAISLGLEELTKQRQSEREKAEIIRIAISLGLKELEKLKWVMEKMP